MAISSFKYKDPNTNTWKSIAAIKGETGATGATGSQGPAGPGVPTGGMQGQVLTKTSATDYATQWADPTGSGSGTYIGPEPPADSSIDLWVDTDDTTTGGGLPAGGTAGQVLVKNSATNYDVSFVTLVETYTDSGWTVRKWDDGTVECWRDVSDHTFACTSAIGSLYQNAAGQHVINYPTGLFVSSPSVHITTTANNGRFVSLYNYGNNSSTVYVDLVMMTAASTSILPKIHIYAIGKWKQEETT